MTTPERNRRGQILSSALAIFLRFGFRKTSMDDIARALDLSRQALYSHFRNKDDLFRATLEHALLTASRDGAARLSDKGEPLLDRIALAYEEHLGRYIGLGADLADLHEATQRLGADMMQRSEDEFRALVRTAIDREGLPSAYRKRGVSAEDLSQAIDALARGTKHLANSREDFGRRLRDQLRVLLVPFAEPSS